MKKQITIGLILLSFLFVGRIYAEISTKECTIYTQKNHSGLEEKEQLVTCSDGVMYSNGLYKFAIISLPPDWDTIHLNQRDPTEKGKIASLAFSPGDQPVLLHIIMKKTQNTSIEQELKEKVGLLENESGGFKLESEPAKAEIHKYETRKFIYSSDAFAKVVTYLILEKGFSYELNFACNTLDSYERYSGDFNKIMNNILIGTEVNFAN
jgi:hypothetical protein